MSSAKHSAGRGLALLSALGAAAALAGAAPGCLELGAQHDRMELHQSACVTCHRDDYDATTSPHHAGLFPETCGDCHTTTEWVPARAIRHDWWPLANRHLEARCTACHTSGFAPGATPTACEGCHRADYDAATAPPHAGYPLECASCHNDAGWRPSTFVHPWALDGAHLRTSCFGCHTGDPPRYAGTPRVCSGCHQADYDGATAPPHAGMPTDCTTCHNTEAWRPSTFVHSWRLDGAHVRTACTSCHTGSPPRYAGTPTQCVDCHRALYDASPEHASRPTTCVDCHTTTAWTPALGGSHPDSVFPRTPPHAMPCLDCHNPSLGPSTRGQNTDCVGCHEGRHAQAIVDRQHADVGEYRFDPTNPHFCLSCHPNGRH